MERIKCFLLVDDSKATNFFNKTMITKTDCVEEIAIAKDGKEALEYIQKGNIPEIIFLDINMPVMDGWEFLEAYQELEEKYKNSVIVIMVGAELKPEEIARAKKVPQVKEFKDKMLTKEALFNLMNTYCIEMNENLQVKLRGLVA